MTNSNSIWNVPFESDLNQMATSDCDEDQTGELDDNGAVRREGDWEIILRGLKASCISALKRSFLQRKRKSISFSLRHSQTTPKPTWTFPPCLLSLNPTPRSNRSPSKTNIKWNSNSVMLKFDFHSIWLSYTCTHNGVSVRLPKMDCWLCIGPLHMDRAMNVRSNIICLFRRNCK